MKPRVISALLHVGAVMAMLHLGAIVEDRKPPPVVQIADTKIVYHPEKPVEREDAEAGGGGHDVRPASLGEAPQTAPRQFLAPTTRVSDHVPLLPVEPTLPGLAMDGPRPMVIGMPGGVPGPPSDGPGGGAGIGTGPGRGIGPGDRDGVGGRGQLGWTEGPAVLYQIEPEYSEEARKARLTGTVVLYVDIDERGQVSRVEVRQSLGLGLDEKAVEAIRKWRFRPARKDGKAVPSAALVDVGFRLL
ncbi:MAG: energy transducer TonB [Bryobacterales bacterium]|nr:energy transducer TonB [Bryobacterales bacterium]